MTQETWEEKEKETFPAIVEGLAELSASKPSLVSQKYHQLQKVVEHEIREYQGSIGGLDNLWLMLDKLSEFDPIVLTTFTLRGKVELKVVQNALLETTKEFPRFRQRLAGRDRILHGPHFEDYPDFDIGRQVRLERLPGKGDANAFDAFVSRFISRKWDLDAPLWEAVLCLNYNDADGDAALVLRSHHALADGQGFIRAALWATSYRPQIEKLIAGPPPTNGKANDITKPSDIDSRLTGLDQYSRQGGSAELLHVLLLTYKTAQWTVEQVKTSLWTILDALALMSLAALTWWRMVHLTPSNLEERLNFNIPRSERPSRGRTYADQPRQRDFARSQIIAMSDIKAMQKYYAGKGTGRNERITTRLGGSHVTLNDVVVAILSEVLHRQKAKRRQELHTGRVSRFLDKFLCDRVVLFVPISYRIPSDETVQNASLGGLVYLPVPPALDKPNRSTLDMYHTIARARFSMSLIKRSRTPRRLARWIVNPIARIPVLFPWPLADFPGSAWARREITTPLVNTILCCVHAVVTNVPGPATETVTLQDQYEISHWTIAPPQGPQGTVGIGILSYAGGLCISAISDADIKIDPEARAGGLAKIICDDFNKTATAYLAAVKDDAEHKIKFD